ncbi:MAG: RNA polymerase sigma factor [Longimicrobiales bacterium]
MKVDRRGRGPTALGRPEPDTRDGRGERLSAQAQEQLVRRAQAGDREAFDELYAQNVERVYAVCMRMSGSVPRAEQLTQDAFVRAWRKLPSFRGDSAFSSWLHRLAVNVVLEEGRREQRREARVMPVGEPSDYDRPTLGMNVETRLDLERAIATLPRGARTVLVLFDVEGYRQEEIAQLLGIAVGTVKAQLHRARGLLRKALDR